MKKVFRRNWPFVKANCSHGSQFALSSGSIPLREIGRPGVIRPAAFFEWRGPAIPKATAGNTRPNASYKLASLAGFEPAAHGLEGRCSVQLSYRDMSANSKWQTAEINLVGAVRFELTISCSQSRRDNPSFATPRPINCVSIITDGNIESQGNWIFGIYLV